MIYTTDVLLCKSLILLEGNLRIVQKNILCSIEVVLFHRLLYVC